MKMYGEGADPRNATLKTGETISGAGYILTHEGTTNTLKPSADATVPVGISAGDSTRDVDGTLQTSAGALVSYYPLGGVLMVASKASQTYTTGLKVYAGAGGLALDSQDNSEKVLGIYVGEGVTTSSSDGDLVPVATAGAATA